MIRETREIHEINHFFFRVFSRVSRILFLFSLPRQEETSPPPGLRDPVTTAGSVTFGTFGVRPGGCHGRVNSRSCYGLACMLSNSPPSPRNMPRLPDNSTRRPGNSVFVPCNCTRVLCNSPRQSGNSVFELCNYARVPGNSPRVPNTFARAPGNSAWQSGNKSRVPCGFVCVARNSDRAPGDLPRHPRGTAPSLAFITAAG